MEESRDYMSALVQKEKNVSFENIFANCDTRIHAIFLFLSLLELVQQNYLKILTGEGRNNFILEWNEEREPDTESSFENETEESK